MLGAYSVYNFVFFVRTKAKLQKLSEKSCRAWAQLQSDIFTYKSRQKLPKFTCKNILGRRDSVNRHLLSKWLVSFHHASCVVRQQPWARVIHITWCKSTKNVLRCSIWDMVMDFTAHLLTWKCSLRLWPGTKPSSTCYSHLNLRSGYAYQFIEINSLTYNITPIILTYLTLYFYSISSSLFYIQTRLVLTL